MAASRFVEVTDKEISEIKINSVPNNTKDFFPLNFFFYLNFFNYLCWEHFFGELKTFSGINGPAWSDYFPTPLQSNNAGVTTTCDVSTYKCLPPWMGS